MLFIVSSGTAVGENLPVDQKDTNNLDIDQGELKEKGLLDRFTNLLSFSGVQSTYEPGETMDLKVEAEAVEDFNADGSSRIVNVYKCADSSCDTSPPIDSSSEDKCSREEWWPEYDDCISYDSETTNFDYEVSEGSTWTWRPEFNAPEDEAHYMLVGYIHKDGFVTDVSEEKFTVESTEPEPEPEPKIIENGVSIGKTSNTISATIDLENTGDRDMTESHIVEMQVRPQGSGLLSYVSSHEDTCDPDHPENVHKDFRLDSGDSEEISLSTNVDNLEKGENYDVWVITRSSCHEDGENDPVEPFGTGYKADTLYLEEDPEPNVEQASEDIEVSVGNGDITSQLSFINNGDGDMQESDIVEMQVRPRGEGIMSFATGTSPQKTCESSHPENVYREFQIKAGETVGINLSTDRENLEDGKYDVWIITREECGGGPVQPYGTGRIADTIEISSDDDDNDLPLLPIGAAVGAVLVFGGVYYRIQ